VTKFESVASVGDTNGDGFGDLLVVKKVIGSDSWELSAEVYFGIDLAQHVNLATLPSSTFGFGGAIPAGDLNGDGFSDIFARCGSSTADLTLVSTPGGPDPGALPPFSWATEAPYGTYIDSFGDWNGDGFDDVALRDDDGVLFIHEGGPSGLATEASAKVGAPLMGERLSVGMTLPPRGVRGRALRSRCERRSGTYAVASRCLTCRLS
jgi:hypothetical protein